MSTLDDRSCRRDIARMAEVPRRRFRRPVPYCRPRRGRSAASQRRRGSLSLLALCRANTRRRPVLHRPRVRSAQTRSSARRLLRATGRRTAVARTYIPSAPRRRLDLGRLDRERVAQFEIAGVHKAAGVALDHELCAAEHMSGREQRQTMPAFFPRLVERVLFKPNRRPRPRFGGSSESCARSSRRAKRARQMRAVLGVVTSTSCSRA